MDKSPAVEWVEAAAMKKLQGKEPPKLYKSLFKHAFVLQGSH
jgi:hypothetical protein